MCAINSFFPSSLIYLLLVLLPVFLMVNCKWNHALLSLSAELPSSGLPTGHEMHNYLASDDRGGPRSVKDTQTIGSAYDRYLQSVV